MVYFNDIDSLYPLLLCLLMAFCATIYESIQVFAPETWQHFYLILPCRRSRYRLCFLLSDGYLAVYSGVAGGTRRFVSPVKSGGGRILSVGAGLLLHLLLFFFILTTSIYVGYLF